MIWRQPRDMFVSNYANHIVYEIYTHSENIYFIQNKETLKIECVKNISNSNRNETLPCVWGGEGGQTVLQDKRLS